MLFQQLFTTESSIDVFFLSFQASFWAARRLVVNMGLFSSGNVIWVYYMFNL